VRYSLTTNGSTQATASSATTPTRPGFLIRG
jgi:hypothetical protein